MALDYFIQTNCAIQQNFNYERFVHALKANGITQQIWERTGGNVSSLGKFTWGSPQGDRQYSFDELLAEIAPINSYCDALERKGAGCKFCEVSRLQSGGRYACFGHINYPISAAAEYWLCNLLEDSFAKRESFIPHIIIHMDNQHGSNQTKYNYNIKHNPWFANRIQSPKMLFELDTSPSIKYQNTSFIIDEIYFLLFEMIPDNKQIREKQVRDEIVNVIRACKPDMLKRPPDQSAQQFISFFQAVELVNQNEYLLYVD